MPVLKDFRQTKKISLPSHPESEVEIYDSVLVGQLLDRKINVEENNFKSIIEYLPRLIKSWNFCDESKKILPINIDSLSLFKPEDITFLFEEVNKFSDSLKKNLNEKPQSA